MDGWRTRRGLFAASIRENTGVKWKIAIQRADRPWCARCIIHRGLKTIVPPEIVPRGNSDEPAPLCTDAFDYAILPLSSPWFVYVFEFPLESPIKVLHSRVETFNCVVKFNSICFLFLSSPSPSESNIKRFWIIRNWTYLKSSRSFTIKSSYKHDKSYPRSRMREWITRNGP